MNHIKKFFVIVIVSVITFSLRSTSINAEHPLIISDRDKAILNLYNIAVDDVISINLVETYPAILCVYTKSQQHIDIRPLDETLEEKLSVQELFDLKEILDSHNIDLNSIKSFNIVPMRIPSGCKVLNIIDQFDNSQAIIFGSSLKRLPKSTIA